VSNGELPLLFQVLLMMLVITNIALSYNTILIFSVKMVIALIMSMTSVFFATHSSPSAYEFDNTIFYDAYGTEILDAPSSSQILIPKTTVKREPDFQKLWPLFGWLSTDIIQKTFEHTTQYAHLATVTMLKKVFRSPNPALNIHRRKEDFACDIVYSDVPAIFDCSTAAVIFVGTSTKVTDVHGIKKDNQFANNLEDNIIQ
jgi:hypothetical protein